MIILVVVALFVLWWFFRPRAVAVETMTVPTPANASASAGDALSATGYVVAREHATISSKVTGMVQKVLVSEGDHVKQGQLVAVLDDSLEQAAVQQAQAALAMDTARIGESRASFVETRLTFNRQQSLAGKHLVSEAALDKARSDFKSAKATLAAAKAQVKVDNAALDSAKLQLSYTKIYAPFTGIVTQVYAHPGEMISPAAVGGFTKTGICDLVNMGSLEVNVDVNEDYLTQLKAKMPATIVLSAYQNKRFPAGVEQIVPVVNKAQATVGVRIAFKKLDPSILPGMQAQVFFGSGVDTSSTTDSVGPIHIPAKTVRHDADGSFVYLLVKGRIKRQPVRVRSLPDGKDLVLSGLSGGEKVVTHADASLHGGMSVASSSD